MSNGDISATWRYHDTSKHSLRSVQSSRHVLDWENQPIPYKIYSSLPAIPLPTKFPPSDVPTLHAIAATDTGPAGERIPDLLTLARLCFFANGVTKVLHTPRGELAFRAAACTGALFHIELYLVCGDLPDLAAGVYHYGVHDHSLRQLREGDYRRTVIQAAGEDTSVAEAPVVAVLTSTFWRNAWKYQARAYRHSFWDGGTILANLLAEAAAVEVPAGVVVGFADDSINELVDVDGRREAAISLVALGRTTQSPGQIPANAPLDLPTVPLSAREVESPAIHAMHAASSLASGDEAAAWRAEPPPHRLPHSAGPVVPLRPLPESQLPSDSVEAVIRRRGSSRRFTQEPIAFGQLSTMLDRATRGIRGDCFDPARPLNDLYLIVNAVDGLESGGYVLRREERALKLLKRGSFRAEAGYLALGQELAADAAVNVYFLTDLEPVLQRFGNRGYRAGQLEASITAGKLYLAAYALRLGATGLTFFDDDVTAFFSPHATGKSIMFLLALGRPLRRR